MWYNNKAENSFALLAQLDRVTGYEPVGQGFESLAARSGRARTFVRAFALLCPL